MSSPFPGMDPYLEEASLWPAFHRQFVTYMYQMLLPGLVERFRARIGQRHYTTEQPLFTSVLREEHHEGFLEIRQRNDGRLVTLIDVVSPANKTTSNGRKAYLDKRDEGRQGGANIVEVDLVLQGEPLHEHARAGVPEWDYAVIVTRSSQPERPQIYTTMLRKRLPRIRLPLAGEDHETLLDLQVLLARSYDQCGFAAKIDYRGDPPVQLDEEKQRWLVEHLKQQRLRD